MTAEPPNSARARGGHEPGDEAGRREEAYAQAYDHQPRLGAIPDTDRTVAVLAELAGGGPVLELGVGTGRVAIPLAQRGLEVHGIDRSEPMLAQLRAKVGGDAVQLSVGDFADVAVEGRFSLVYAVLDTFFGLLTQDEQVRCFQNVADHLVEGGRFLIEASVPTQMPDLDRYIQGQSVWIKAMDEGNLHLDAGMLDPLSQRVATQRVIIDNDGVRMFPIVMRYSWPSEMDLMARLARLQLAERWDDWRRRPVSRSSSVHISLYEAP